MSSISAASISRLRAASAADRAALSAPADHGIPELPSIARLRTGTASPSRSGVLDAFARSRPSSTAHLSPTASSLLRAPDERWQHGVESERLSRTDRDQPQRVRTALAALVANGRVDGAGSAAAARWTRDYELGVHLARDPESVGTGSGSPDGVSVAACDALSRHRETSLTLGAAGTEIMLLVGHRCWSLSAVARHLNPTGTGKNVGAATNAITTTLATLVEHYDLIDGRAGRARQPWAERVPTHLRSSPHSGRRTPATGAVA